MLTKPNFAIAKTNLAGDVYTVGLHVAAKSIPLIIFCILLRSQQSLGVSKRNFTSTFNHPTGGPKMAHFLVRLNLINYRPIYKLISLSESGKHL